MFSSTNSPQLLLEYFTIIENAVSKLINQIGLRNLIACAIPLKPCFHKKIDLYKFIINKFE